MREWLEAEMSMPGSGFLSAADGFGIAEPLPYYDVLAEPLGFPFQDVDLQAQQQYGHSSMQFCQQGTPVTSQPCYPPYPYSEPPPAPAADVPAEGRPVVAGLPLLKRARPGAGGRVRGQGELCVVCGDKASGYHYNALTCEGCKGFFRRSVTKKAVYRCKSGGGCEMDMYMRRKCQDCRLRKCRAVGMLAECLLTEVQCQSKRLRKSAKHTGRGVCKREEEDVCEGRAVSSSCRSSAGLSKHEQSLLDCIVEAHRRFRGHDALHSWALEPLRIDDGEVRLADSASPHCQRLRQFSCSLPGFELLDSADQMTLISCSSVEVMFLLSAQHFAQSLPLAAADAQSWPVSTLYPLSIDPALLHWLKSIDSRHSDSLCTSGTTEELLAPVMNFFHSMSALAVSEAEYALLTATALLCSEHASLRASSCVENLQEGILEVMAHVCGLRSDPQRFPRLLGRLTELRTLRHNHLVLLRHQCWGSNSH